MKRIIQATLVSFMTLMLATCFLYEEKIYDNPFDPELTGGAYNPPFATIRLDGNLSDWDSIPTFIYDETFEATSSGQPSVPGGDLQEIKVAQDDENLYFYVSTASGSPLENPEMSFNINLHDDDWTFNMSPVNLSHNTDGSAGLYSGYNWRVSGDIWDGYNIENAAVRFPGFNALSNALEYGISKTVYWNIFATNEKLAFSMESWYNPYEVSFGDGTLDRTDDGNNQDYLLIKGVSEVTPSADVPIVQFDRPSFSLNIDGFSSDFNIWEETGHWYQDAIGDDLDILGEPNCDIDKIYMKQDDENIYMLLTFSDPAPYVGAPYIYYDLYASRTDGYNHTFRAEHDGSTGFLNYGVDYQSILNPANCLAFSAEDGYVELQFDKSAAWADLPFGAFEFRLEVRDSGSNMVDQATFMGSYKGLTDPTPLP